MARTEHLLALAKIALDADAGQGQAVAICRQIIALEKPQSGLRAHLENLLPQRKMAKRGRLVSARTLDDCAGLLLQTTPNLPLVDVLLPEAAAQGVAQFLKERRHTDALRAAGLSASHRILLSGPPGNGKTTLAGAIADSLGLPFLVMDYSRAISGYMGATGANLAKVFRAVAQAPTSAALGRHSVPQEDSFPQGLVLFVDEMETLLTERDRGKGDVGEIARVTSSLLLEIDRLPDHVVLIGATNHSEMLDRAVIRRFEHHWLLPAPTRDTVDHWLQRFSQRYPSVPLMEHRDEVLQGAEGSPLSDIEQTALAWCRAWVVEKSLHQRQPATQPL
jgi:AAA+ superfamily predicted ATPase